MISPEVIDKVLDQAIASASHSWEYGTVFEALLEYRSPACSIFKGPSLSHQGSSPSIEGLPALQYVKRFVHTNSATLCEGNGTIHTPSTSSIRRLISKLRFICRPRLARHTRVTAQ